MNQFFLNKTSPQKAKMNRFMVLESQNHLSTNRHRHLLHPSFFRAPASSRLWENDSCSSRSHTSHSLSRSLTLPVCQSARHSVGLCLPAFAWFPSRWRWQRRHTVAPRACTTYTHLRHDGDSSALCRVCCYFSSSFTILI